MRLNLLSLLVLSLVLSAPAAAQPLSFTEATSAANVAYSHGYVGPLLLPGGYDEPRAIAGGVAAGDYDGDGQIDLYAVRGDAGANLLFHNLGDGTFEEVAALVGVALTGVSSSGPVFVDIDGDGYLDLFVGGVGGTPVSVFRNEGDGTFEDVTALTGFGVGKDVFSAAFGDYDRDGDLDAALTHWRTPLLAGVTSETLWRNEGGFAFVDVSLPSGIAAVLYGDAFLGLDLTFTPNFVDIDSDGWLDLLLANDFKQSKVLHNEGDGTFADDTDLAVITDENGMGAAVGDYDNDGVLDWFVSSIWDPAGFTIESWGVTGNRLYRGNGDGTFTDVTTAAGVREGYWGWGSTFADFDNDGNLDLFHTNGWGQQPGPPTEVFFTDPARLFLSNGDGTFSEQSSALGVVDRGQGRAVVAFDQERDGDLDLLVTNMNGPARFFRNTLGDASYLTVRLHGLGPNTQAIGARVYAATGLGTQMREIRAGSNFESQDPAEAHFGLGGSAEVTRLRVVWPRGGYSDVFRVAADRVVDIQEPANSCGDGVPAHSSSRDVAYGEQCDDGVGNGTVGSSCQVNCLRASSATQCTAAEPIAKPRLRVKALGRPGQGHVRIQGHVVPPPGWDLEPEWDGFVAEVRNAAGDVVLEIALPPGPYDRRLRAGWRLGPGSDDFSYRGPNAAARITTEPSGRVRVRVTAKNGTHDLGSTDEPLSLTFRWKPYASVSTECASHTFADADCAFAGAAARLRCR